MNVSRYAIALSSSISMKGAKTMYKAKSPAALRDMAVVGVFAAFMCIIAPWTIPVGAVPITLATFAVYLAPATLGWKRGSAAVAVYLMLGFVGLPVFSGFSGGIQKLVGATGGYLVAYIPMAAVGGLMADRFKKVWAYAVGMVLGTAVLYTFGTAWYCLMSGVELIPAILTCVTPFLPGDAAKIACAAVLSSKLRPIADKFR